MSGSLLPRNANGAAVDTHWYADTPTKNVLASKARYPFRAVMFQTLSRNLRTCAMITLRLSVATHPMPLLRRPRNRRPDGEPVVLFTVLEIPSVMHPRRGVLRPDPDNLVYRRQFPASEPTVDTSQVYVQPPVSVARHGVTELRPTEVVVL